MERQAKLMQYVDPRALGLEIGASHLPLAPKSQGYNVHVVDHMTREDLIEKYQNDGLDLSRIEEVDFVWKGEPYAELLGPERKYKWILASHLIEHTPDFIGFFLDCASVLADDGIISLAVPDKRCCFDRYRPITGLSQMVDSHHRKQKRHTPGTAAEFYANSVHHEDGKASWEVTSPGNWEFTHSLEVARFHSQAMLQGDTYVDYHSWCFVPHSFRLLIHDLYHLGYLPFQEVGFYPTYGHEFFITLGRNGKGIDKTRMEMLQLIELELAGHRTQGGDADRELLKQSEEQASLRHKVDVLQQRLDEVEASGTFRLVSFFQRGLNLFRNRKSA